MRWIAMLAGYGFIAGHIGLLWATVIAVAAVAVAYRVSLALHPHVRCRLCKGTGRHAGWLFTYAERPCVRCGGQPRERRRGVMVFSPSQPTAAEQRGEAGRNRRNRMR